MSSIIFDAHDFKSSLSSVVAVILLFFITVQMKQLSWFFFFLFLFLIQKIVDIDFFISNLAKGHRSIGHHFAYVVSVSYIKSSMKSLVYFKLAWLIHVSFIYEITGLS
jgi:hypothetical protein